MTLAKFDKIKTMETLDVGFGQLKITFHNGQSPVILQCLSKYQNKQLAYLIDGYCVLMKTIAENGFELDDDKGSFLKILLKYFISCFLSLELLTFDI